MGIFLKDTVKKDRLVSLNISINLIFQKSRGLTGTKLPENTSQAVVGENTDHIGYKDNNLKCTPTNI